MLGYKRDREGRRHTHETVERKTEASPDGHVVTTETISRETEEEYRESEQQLQIDAEILKLEKIPALLQLEEEKMKSRQKLAEDPYTIRYTFQWIEQDIQRAKTPLPLISPAQMEAKGWSVVEGPELVWIPLYWRATRVSAVVDLPDLIWISEMEFREKDRQLWACCDFQWSDDRRQLRGAWIPELLLRTYPPYAEVVNAASHHKIRVLYGDMEYATQKRIQMLQRPGLETRPACSTPLALEHENPLVTRVSDPPNREKLESMFDHPESVSEDLDKLRKELQNVMVPHVQKHLDTLSLAEQLFFLGDAGFVVSRYYMAAIDGNQELKLPRIQVANYIEGTKIRCKVDGLEDPVWLPASLIFAGHAQCRCGPICSCRWRALEVAYDALVKFICG